MRARRARVRLSGPRSLFVSLERRSKCVSLSWLLYVLGLTSFFSCSRRDGALAERENNGVVMGQVRRMFACLLGGSVSGCCRTLPMRLFAYRKIATEAPDLSPP